jgi:hypothetical protein
MAPQCVRFQVEKLPIGGMPTEKRARVVDKAAYGKLVRILRKQGG